MAELFGGASRPGRGELATIISTSFWLVQMCVAAVGPVQNCPRSNPRCEIDQIPSLPTLRRGVLLAGFGEGHPGSGKRCILPRVRGHTVRLPGRCRHGRPPLRGGHTRAEDAARGPSEHASQTRLRGAARQLPVQDRYPRNAHGARPYAGLKPLPPTPMTALSSTGIQPVMLSFLGSTCMVPSNLCARVGHGLYQPHSSMHGLADTFLCILFLQR